MAESSLTVRAPAKINLCLDVIGRRPDGMHEVATILQSIDLADRLRLTVADSLTLECQGMAVDENNLILRAAKLLQEHGRITQGCAIECWKTIPIGAGLGGGSADAAATLLALNRLWGVGAGIDELADLAARLGADVPFGLRGGTALGTGTGSTLQPLPDAPPHWLVLVPIEAQSDAKTAEMYRALTPADYTNGDRSRIESAAIPGGRLDYARVGSAFTRAARERWPSVAGALELLERTRPLAASVTGAGPSVFALYPSRAAARAGQRAFGPPARVHRFTSSGIAPPS